MNKYYASPSILDSFTTFSNFLKIFLATLPSAQSHIPKLAKLPHRQHDSADPTPDHRSQSQSYSPIKQSPKPLPHILEANVQSNSKENRRPHFLLPDPSIFLFHNILESASTSITRSGRHDTSASTSQLSPGLGGTQTHVEDLRDNVYAYARLLMLVQL